MAIIPTKIMKYYGRKIRFSIIEITFVVRSPSISTGKMTMIFFRVNNRFLLASSLGNCTHVSPLRGLYLTVCNSNLIILCNLHPLPVACSNLTIFFYYFLRHRNVEIFFICSIKINFDVRMKSVWLYYYFTEDTSFFHITF